VSETANGLEIIQLNGVAHTLGVSETGAAGAVTVNHDNVFIGNSAANTIVAGDGADTINGGDSSDSINLTEAVAAVDVVQLTGTAAITSGTVNVDTVTGFASGSDDIQFGSTFVGDYAISSNVSLGASNGFASGNASDIYIVNDSGSASDDAAVATLIGTAFSAASNQEAVFIVNNGDGDASIYYVDDNLDGTNTDVTATDVVLIGVLDVGAESLVAGNFAGVTI
jgi:hypothetical protein